MLARYVQKGDAIDYRPTEAVAAGDVVIIADLIGIARLDIEAGTLGSLAVVGVFDVVKADGAIPGKDAAPAARLRMRFYPGFESGKHRGGESRGHARSLTQARMLNIGKPGASAPGDFHCENLTSFREKIAE